MIIPREYLETCPADLLRGPCGGQDCLVRHALGAEAEAAVLARLLPVEEGEALGAVVARHDEEDGGPAQVGLLTSARLSQLSFLLSFPR